MTSAHPRQRDGLRSLTSCWPGLTCEGLHRRLKEEGCPVRLLLRMAQWWYRASRGAKWVLQCLVWNKGESERRLAFSTKPCKDKGESARHMWTAGDGRWQCHARLRPATMPPRHCRALAGTCAHGLSWAPGKRALPLKLFPKFQNQHKL
jgi:hypothetical protein